MDNSLDTNYYVYYNKETGDILSVTNELHSIYTDKINISFDAYERLVTGKDKFSDYRVGTRLDETIDIIPIADDRYNFNNKMLSWIVDIPNKDTDIVIEWHKHTNVWKFSLATSRTITVESFMFFVVLNHDFDFLIRCFDLSVLNLLKEPIYFPFETKFEEDITKINIATKNNGYSVGLITLYE